jgi:4-hydroxy 2-oxovalerate aldolase
MELVLCDSTLRDGSHAIRHQYTIDMVQKISKSLDDAGVPVIEVTHGDGLGGSSYNYGRSLTNELDLIQAAKRSVSNAEIAVLLIPGIGTREDLRESHDAGASIVRVATHCTEADIAIQHIGLARGLGMKAIGFLMMSHLAQPGELADQATIMADAGAEVVYVVDSAGALLPDQARVRVERLRQSLPESVEVGFHGHMNLGLGVANSMAAIEVGATWVDGSTIGIGAGAGNTPLEVLVAVCELSGIEMGIDMFMLLDAAEDVVRTTVNYQPRIGRSSILLGYAGVYGSFLRHAERASDRFDVPTKDILLEAGRRKAVGGQEDIVLEIAAAMASERNGNTAVPNEADATI